MPRFPYVVEIKRANGATSILGTRVSIGKGHVWASDPADAVQKVRMKYPGARRVDIIKSGSSGHDLSPEEASFWTYVGAACGIVVVGLLTLLIVYLVTS